MKVELITPEIKFIPVTVQITFETEREYNFFKQGIGNISGSEWIIAANTSSGTNSIKNFGIDDTSITSIIYNILP